MAEALSQSQIDALLNSMANGGFEEEKKEEKYCPHNVRIPASSMRPQIVAFYCM